MKTLRPLVIPMIAVLIAVGDTARVQTQSQLDRSLLQAAADDDANKVKSLISQGADVNARNYNGTVLQIATQGGHKLLVELLIRAGANVNDGIGSGAYAFYYAAVYGYKDVAELLIDNGADARARDPMGYTSLHFAASGGHRSVAELLIARGADVDARQKEDRTPLHEAAKWGHADVVELLINKGANVDARDKDGRTPLWYAKASRNEGVVGLLPRKGLGHDVAVTDISVPASITQDERASVIVNLVNKSDYSEPIAVTLTDVTDAITIGTKSVHLSPAGFRGMDEICDLIFDSPIPGRQAFGYPVVCGDVNGDDYDDLLISAQMWNNARGRAYLHFGGTNMDTTPDKTFTGEQTGDRFSGGGGSLGDVNGDNYPDVILGAPGYSGGAKDGRVYIFYGGPDMDENADLILEGEHGGGGSYGSTIVTGDLNNDSHDDVVVTAMLMNSETGRAYLYYGGDSMDSNCDLTFNGENAIDWFGRKAAIGGDVNGDGYADLIIGARRYPGGKQKGRAYLF